VRGGGNRKESDVLAGRHGGGGMTVNRAGGLNVSANIWRGGFV